MKRFGIVFLFLLFITSTFVGLCHGVEVSYNLLNQSGNRWEYEYTVFNNSVSGGIWYFDIYFPAISDPLASNYSNFDVTGNPDLSNWNLRVELPGSDDGFFEAYTDSTPVALGQTMTGFKVAFDYTGGAVLGKQFFDVWEYGQGSSLNLIFEGSTQPANQVPEPCSLILLTIGCIGMVMVRRRTKALIAGFLHQMNRS